MAIKLNKNKKYTSSEVKALMYQYGSEVFKVTAEAIKEKELTEFEILNYLIQGAEELEAQSLVIPMGCELGYSTPN